MKRKKILVVSYWTNISTIIAKKKLTPISLKSGVL